MPNKLLACVGLITCVWWACRLVIWTWEIHQKMDDIEKGE